MPETMEMTENFAKVTKYLTKSKETLKIMVEKFSCQKVVRIKFSVDSVSKYEIWQKTQTWKCWKSPESFLNKKFTHCLQIPLLESC